MVWEPWHKIAYYFEQKGAKKTKCSRFLSLVLGFLCFLLFMFSETNGATFLTVQPLVIVSSRLSRTWARLNQAAQWDEVVPEGSSRPDTTAEAAVASD